MSYRLEKAQAQVIQWIEKKADRNVIPLEGKNKFNHYSNICIYPTPLHKQGETQGQFLSEV